MARKGVGGRKALWDELGMADRLEAIRGWALQGTTDKEMMQYLGISHETFYKWKKNYPEFNEAIKAGRFESDGEILNSAFKQTQGYYVQVTEPVKLRDEYGAEHVEMVTYDKFIPANSTMTLFMLKNRLPQHYRDKQERDITGNMAVTFVEDLEDDAE